jgi:hypothetical protein
MKLLLIAVCTFRLLATQVFSEEPKKPDVVIDAEPETVLREFLKAMVIGDQETGSRLILDNPDTEILWRFPVPKEHLTEATKSIEGMSLKRMKVDDTYALPNGKKLIVTERDVNPDRLLVIDANEPSIPFILVKSGKRWKVDASPLIAARKAAEKVRTRSK